MKTIIYLLTIICLVFINGCIVEKQQIINIKSKINENQLPQVCKGLHDLVEEGWYYDERNGYYINNWSFFDELGKYQDCLKQLTVEQVKLIFGEPMRKYNNTICYYISSKCENIDLGCTALVFEIGDNNKIKSGGSGHCGPLVVY